MKKPKVKSAAILTIHKPGRMTERGRQEVVKWLMLQAKHLERSGNEYTDGTYRARYLYTDMITRRRG